MQLVIAAITTCPWSSSSSEPSARRTGVGLLTRSGCASGRGRSGSPPLWEMAGGSLAGKDSSEASLTPFRGRPGAPASASAALKEALASVRAVRSCGRLGPARLGTTVARSSSRVSE